MRKLLWFVPILLILCGILLYHRHNPVERPYAPQTSHPSDLSRQSVISVVNQERQKANLSPLKEDKRLDASASQKCQDMVANGYYAHDNPKTGMHGTDYIKQQSVYGYLAENLTRDDFVDSTQIVQAWLDSPKHREIMLDSKYHLTGVALCHSNSLLWTDWIVVEHFAS